MKHPLINLLILLLAGQFLSACIPLEFKNKRTAGSAPDRQGQSVEDALNFAVIMGKITGRDSLNHPFIVIATPLDEPSGNSFNYVILHQEGQYMLYLPAGDYRLYTISDFNGDNRFESGEVSGRFQGGTPVSIQKGEVQAGVDMVSEQAPIERGNLPETIEIQYEYDSIDYDRQNGQQVKIYDAVFSSKNAEVGLWRPEEFLKAFGANIYLVEAYDPAKIPVLFVHGINGSPQNWLPFLIRLDRERFQPWFFYYPSGLRLKLVANILFQQLTQLHREFEFNRICLVAHSMGGFVTQSLLTDRRFEENLDFVDLYVTFATPWSGFQAADAASDSPFILPASWTDLASRSMFIKNLLKRPLPESIPYYLFYGRKDSVSGGRALDERAFDHATGKFGFDENHDGILSSKEAFLKFESLLNSHFQDKVSLRPLRQ